MVICHGGPIAMPDDAKYVLENTENVVGFFGASSIERLPTEAAIKKQTEDFKKLVINNWLFTSQAVQYRAVFLLSINII